MTKEALLTIILSNGHLCLGDFAESDEYQEFARATADKILELV